MDQCTKGSKYPCATNAAAASGVRTLPRKAKRDCVPIEHLTANVNKRKRDDDDTDDDGDDDDNHDGHL